MREILFGGKQETNNEWIEGGIVPSLNGKEFYIGNMFEANKVIPETVVQYTGLNDKNGKKIFEGDILKIDGSIYYVKFHNGTFGVVIKHGSYAGSIPKVASYVQDFIEVIGNIHDNPELLGGDTDV